MGKHGMFSISQKPRLALVRVPGIARNLGIPTAFYSIVIAATVCFFGTTSPEALPDDRKLPEDFTVSPKWVPFPSTVAFRLFQVLRLYKRITGDETSVSDLYRFMESARGCNLIAVRSCSQIEPEWLNLLGVIHGKSVLPVGVLSTAPNNDDNDDTWRSTKEWLDRQRENTVVYVAFGTEAMPSQAKVTEIALGLEKSGLPFFWVLRTKHGEDAVKLPEGFEERNEGIRGIVCRSWAPQLKILAHDSLGVFLSHSGWSSVVESLSFGRPLVLLPMSNDQGLNARLFEEKKIGYELPRDENDGSFTSETVAGSLKMMVKKEEGRVYRDAAKEWKPVFEDIERQDGYVDKFLEHLTNHA